LATAPVTRRVTPNVMTGVKPQKVSLLVRSIQGGTGPVAVNRAAATESIAKPGSVTHSPGMNSDFEDM
jgi:hypothetical protein